MVVFILRRAVCLVTVQRHLRSPLTASLSRLPRLWLLTTLLASQRVADWEPTSRCRLSGSTCTCTRVPKTFLAGKTTCIPGKNVPAVSARLSICVATRIISQFSASYGQKRAGIEKKEKKLTYLDPFKVLMKYGERPQPLIQSGRSVLTPRFPPGRCVGVILQKYGHIFWTVTACTSMM